MEGLVFLAAVAVAAAAAAGVAAELRRGQKPRPSEPDRQE